MIQAPRVGAVWAQATTSALKESGVWGTSMPGSAPGVVVGWFSTKEGLANGCEHPFQEPGGLLLTCGVFGTYTTAAG
jgi:hypothetical protein